MLKLLPSTRLHQRGVLSVFTRNCSKIMSEESNRQSKLYIASFGNTGTVGNAFVQSALANASVEKIYLVNRRVLPEKIDEDPRIVHILMTDFENGYADAFDNIKPTINMVHWALGSPPTPGYALLCMGSDQYHNAHVKYPTKAAEYFNSKNSDIILLEMVPVRDLISTSYIKKDLGKGPYQKLPRVLFIVLVQWVLLIVYLHYQI